MQASIPRIAITTGEPAGIGPDISLQLSRINWPAHLVLIGDMKLLQERAEALGLAVELVPFDAKKRQSSTMGKLHVHHVPLVDKAIAGSLNVCNAPYVVELLKQAGQHCVDSTFDAVTTAPVQKSIINDSGLVFRGHTEYFAELCRVDQVVMLLTAAKLRVALATTHLPLRAVPAAITQESLSKTLSILHHDLQTKFGIKQPRIQVCGLNPHAGENGHLGAEEQTTITPVIEQLNARGFQLTGPVPADTAFNQDRIDQYDAILAMYHDQGLPTLKHAAFGSAINITLGLPIIRTSVDHGTALDLAAMGTASPASLIAATQLAIELANNKIKKLQADEQAQR